MRIGIVTQSYLPIHGGVAENVHHTAVELRRRGHEVKVITAYFDRGDEDYAENVYRIGHDLTIPMNGAFVNITIGTKLGRQLREIEEKERFDIVHIHSALEPVLPLVALKVLKAPKVATFHSYTKKSYGYMVFRPYLKQFAAQLSARIAVSEAARDFISQYFPGTYHVIPNGVDVERFHPRIQPIERFHDGKENIVFIGRMDPRKGLKYLLRAFPAIAAKRPDARLIVVGGGFLAGYYKGFVKNGIHNRVFFEGFASSELLPSYYAAATIFCSPATASESFGIVLIEAMAAGKPIVAFDNPGYRAVLGGEGGCGMLVPNRRIDDLAHTITMLLGDRDRLRQMGENGRKKAQQYSWTRVTDEIEEVYQSVLRVQTRAS